MLQLSGGQQGEGLGQPQDSWSQQRWDSLPAAHPLRPVVSGLLRQVGPRRSFLYVLLNLLACRKLVCDNRPACLFANYTVRGQRSYSHEVDCALSCQPSQWPRLPGCTHLTSWLHRLQRRSFRQGANRASRCVSLCEVTHHQKARPACTPPRACRSAPTCKRGCAQPRQGGRCVSLQHAWCA